MRGWRGVRRWWRRPGGGSCSVAGDLGGSIGDLDLLLGVGLEMEGYDVTLAIGYPLFLRSSFISLTYPNFCSASCTHKSGSCT